MTEYGKPDFDVLIFKRLPENFSELSFDEQIKITDERDEEYKNANWWSWTEDDWKKYFEWREEQILSLGDEYSYHEYEQVLLEFGKWLINHLDEIEEIKLMTLRSMIGDYLFFWRYGEESPIKYDE